MNKTEKQKGHKGSTIDLPCSPTDTIVCVPTECTNCISFAPCQGRKVETRYEVDANITVDVREYVQMEYLCPKSNKHICGKFPANITAIKQYGNKLLGLVITLSAECAGSVNKIHRLLKAVLNVPVSTGFICNAVKSYADTLNPDKLEYVWRINNDSSLQ